MTYLIIVSLIWAFSFGLIGTTLHTINPGIVSALRLLLAFVVFAPLLRRTAPKTALKLIVIGAIQFGLMYLTYNWAFQFLHGHQVALLTVTTPFFVSAAHDLHTSRLSLRNTLLALAAVAGAAIVIGNQNYGFTRHALTGIILTQISNLAFAGGQVAYRSLCRRNAMPQTFSADVGLFGWCYLGALLITLPFGLASWISHPPGITLYQLGALLYLGVVASGLSFFMWNRGARTASPAVLAVMNNLKIPLAVTASLLIFHEPVNLPRLLIGGSAVLAAAALAHYWASR